MDYRNWKYSIEGCKRTAVVTVMMFIISLIVFISGIQNSSPDRSRNQIQHDTQDKISMKGSIVYTISDKWLKLISFNDRQ